MNAATNQPSILTLRLGQSDQAGHVTVLPDATLDDLPGVSGSFEGGLAVRGPLAVSGELVTNGENAGITLEAGVNAGRGNAGLTVTRIYTKEYGENVTDSDPRAASRHGVARAEENRGKEIYNWVPHPDNPADELIDWDGSN